MYIQNRTYLQNQQHQKKIWQKFLLPPSPKKVLIIWSLIHWSCVFTSKKTLLLLSCQLLEKIICEINMAFFSFLLKKPSQTKRSFLTELEPTQGTPKQLNASSKSPSYWQWSSRLQIPLCTLSIYAPSPFASGIFIHAFSRTIWQKDGILQVFSDALLLYLNNIHQSVGHAASQSFDMSLGNLLPLLRPPEGVYPSLSFADCGWACERVFFNLEYTSLYRLSDIYQLSISPIDFCTGWLLWKTVIVVKL